MKNPPLGGFFVGIDLITIAYYMGFKPAPHHRGTIP